MQSSGRKRIVSSCIPCYTKKQKCNRCRPCNHCTRRRLPEKCTYHPSPAPQAAEAEARCHGDVPANHNAHSQDAGSNDEPIGASSNGSTWANLSLGQASKSDSLAELFGYVENSESNTMGLVRRLGLEEDEAHIGNRDIPLEAFDEIEKTVRRLPDRGILDFLVQYYVTEVHWIEQVVFAPWFQGQYQKWWTLGRRSRVYDVEFAVLFLRICSYASQFLPSPSYTIDRIRGIPLADVREACHDVAEKLATICERLTRRPE